MKKLLFTEQMKGGVKMDSQKDLRSRLQDHGLNYTWLIKVLKFRGLVVDKTTLSSAVNGTITGPRVEKIMENSAVILDEYERNFLRSISV